MSQKKFLRLKEGLNFSHKARLFVSGVFFTGTLLLPITAQETGGQGSPPQSQPGTPAPAAPGATSDIHELERMTDPLEVDKRFVQDAADKTATEVELGKLAQEKATNPSVKEFASKVIEDHQKVSEDLKNIAVQANVPLSTDLPKKAKKSHEKLSKLSGEEFDKEYAKQAAKEHKSLVKSFERQSKDSKIPAVKEFATRNLPTMIQHQEMAESLKENSR